MSFTGDLEHLPIVDVIQLLHSTRKSGTLTLKGPKGESQLVFNDGYFVSANHLNNNIRIGQVLIDTGAITQQDLDAALHEQKQAGANRKPLVATLIELGTIDSDAAYNGLEALIEMTIVEVLTWTSGSFSLDVTKIDVSDEYRYFPETLKQEICMNAQSILMDALRIYDEKMRDGTLENLFFADNAVAGDTTAPTDADTGAPDITSDLLGLDALDTLEKRIPDVFAGLKDVDPSKEHRHLIESAAPEMPTDEQERLCTFLTDLSRSGAVSPAIAAAKGRPPLALIVFSKDILFKHAIATACKAEGIFAFTTDELNNLDLIIDQSLSRDNYPVLLLDAAAFEDSPHQAAGLRDFIAAKRTVYRQLSLIMLLPATRDTETLGLLQAGARVVFPFRRQAANTASGDEVVTVTGAVRAYLATTFDSPEFKALKLFRTSINDMNMVTEPPDVALAVLRFAATLFERCITFVVGKDELIAEKGIGIGADKSAGPSAPLMFRIPLDQASVFRTVVEKGELFYGPCNDGLLSSRLHSQIGVPRGSKIVLAPLVCFGKVMALVYGDFGNQPGIPVQVELLDALSRHAGLILDASLLRKKIEKPTQST